MSKKNNNKESSNTVTMSTGKVVALVAVPTIIAGLLGGYIIGNKTGGKDKPSESSVPNTTISSTPLGEKFGLTVDEEKKENDYLTAELPFYDKYNKLDEDSSQKAASEMAIEFSLLRERECSVLVQSSATSYDCYIYNNKNECIMQNADGSMLALFDKDGNNLVYNSNTNSYGLNASVDVVACCEQLTNMIKNKQSGVTVYAADTSEHQAELESGSVKNGDGSETPVEYTGGKITEYIVDIRGSDACAHIYDAMGTENSVEFIQKLKNTLKSSEVDYWVPHIMYDVAYNEAHEIEVYCSVVYVEPQENWIITSATPSKHWELSSDWYSLDLGKLLDGDMETLNNKFNAEVEAIEKSLGIDEIIDELNKELEAQKEQQYGDTTDGTTSGTTSDTVSNTAETPTTEATSN